jgi:hypothetical protein
MAAAMAAVVVEATAASAECSGGGTPAQNCSEPERDGLAGHSPPGQRGVWP